MTSRRFCLSVLCAVWLGGVSGFGASSQSSQGQTNPDETAAVAFLKRSMDKYAKLAAFRATSANSLTTSGVTMPAQLREISYVKPNLFKVVARNLGFIQTVICDGKSEIEFDSAPGQAPKRMEAPDSIASVNSVAMENPRLCGTPLYQFFAGSKNLDGLVDRDRGRVTFGKGERVSTGEPAREVKFYGRDQYGHVAALIGEKSLFVYRIRYDSEPLVKHMSNRATLKSLQAAAADSAKRADVGNGPGVKTGQEAVETPKITPFLSMLTEEKYIDLKTPPSIPISAFKVVGPPGAMRGAVGNPR